MKIQSQNVRRSTRFIAKDKENLGTSPKHKSAEISISTQKLKPIAKLKVKIKKLVHEGGSYHLHA